MRDSRLCLLLQRRLDPNLFLFGTADSYLWSEALLIFTRHDESLDHLGANEVAVELI